MAFQGTRVFLQVLIGSSLLFSAAAQDDAIPGQGDDTGKTVVYRDTWGIPHIYAPSVEAGLYAMGWAQAEDRPEQLLTNFAMALGEYSKIVGENGLQTDLRSRLWDHYGVAKENFNQNPRAVRRHLRAFVKGINDYYAAHPEDLPAWWGDRAVDEYMAIAFGRLFLFNWSIDEAYDDLRRGGVDPNYKPDQRGSNQWAVSPQRSAENAAILLIDPHLSWWGPSRFWEVRWHAGDMVGSGVTLPGSPYIGLGHNAHVAWAMTTGGPDTADVYELTLNPENDAQYRYDGEWRDMTSRDVTIQVRDAGEQTHTLWFSHHGPIIAWTDGKAYAAKVSYADVANGSEAWYELNRAKTYEGVKKALATQTVFPQNVMAADTEGNIYYQRTGRVPKRPDGYDWSKPVDGATPDSEWDGIHDTDDLLQVLNPPQGYMQNCNIPPDAMIPNSPFSIDNVADYIYGSRSYGSARAGWTNQRGARAIALLGADDAVTAAEARDYALDVKVYGVERWLEALRRVHEQFGEGLSDNPDYEAGIDDVLNWDGKLERNSTGALKYYYWRKQLEIDHGEEAVNQAAERIDDWYAIVRGEEPEPIDITEEEMEAAAASFASAMTQLKRDFGSLDVPYGTKFRVGRDDASWPVGGGGDYGTRTLRSMSYTGERDDHARWGRGGQTSTQVVVMSDPIQSWIYLPVGQSDRPDSPHYDDQAEQLFSPRQLKDSWWLPEELAGNTKSRVVLEDAPK